MPGQKCIGRASKNEQNELNPIGVKWNEREYHCWLEEWSFRNKLATIANREVI